MARRYWPHEGICGVDPLTSGGVPSGTEAHTQTSSKKIQVRNNKYYLSSLFLSLDLEVSTLYSFSIGVFTLLIFSKQIDKVIVFHRGYQYMSTVWNLLTRINHHYQLSLAQIAYHCYAASLCDLWSVQQTAVQSDMFCQIQQWERAFKNSPCICQTTTTEDNYCDSEAQNVIEFLDDISFKKCPALSMLVPDQLLNPTLSMVTSCRGIMINFLLNKNIFSNINTFLHNFLFACNSVPGHYEQPLHKFGT